MQPNQEDIRNALRMAQSPAGQQLLQLLRQSGGQELDQAMNQALSGDYRSAKTILNSLLNNPQAMELMKQMGGNHGSDGR